MSSRARLSLDGQWKFSPTDSPATGEWLSIAVPSPWQADARFRDHAGVAWYNREFELPHEWLKPAGVVILGFGAVDYYAEVWLNGRKVGEHEGGYLPFELDITADARPGLNTLSVRVDDPLDIFAEIPHGKQSWYGMLSGIWQSVWVESRPETHIQRVRISTRGEEVSVDVSMRGSLRQDLIVTVFAPDGHTAARAISHTTHVSLRVRDPLLWSPDEPNLYTLTVAMGSDQLVETFGFRTIETRDGRILLNGRPFYLRGALDQDYYPDLICTPPSEQYIEEQFLQARAMGLNCLRVHIKVPDPRYYAAADRIGLLIWAELPNHILLTDEAKRRARETLAGMLERDGNHPSIGIWTIINESWGIDLTDPGQRAWLAEMYSWLKSLDPSRLVVDNSACGGNTHVVTDIADFHNYYAMPDHHQSWREWIENYAARPGWLFAREYQDQYRWKEFLRNPWQDNGRPAASGVDRRGDEPLIVSEFGNWGLPDVAKLADADDGSMPWWFATGMEWSDGVVYPHGIEQRFRHYHFDRVFPSLAALAEASQQMQFAALKYQIEQMRSHESIQGYVITEFTDVHWESNGLLDMARNPKVDHDLLRSVNADDLLIPLWDWLVFSPGETCSIKVLFSHHSQTEIGDAVLEWTVDGNRGAVRGGELSVGACSPFRVTELGAVEFNVPDVEQPAQLRLRLDLLVDEDLVTTTGQDLYIFPDPPKLGGDKRMYAPKFHSVLERLGGRMVDTLMDADVAVVATLDDPCREFLLRGGRVLLLAESDDALQTYLPGIEIQGRAGTPLQGDWASTFGWHRFESIPTAGVVNFAFAGLTPDHFIHGFSPRDLALDVFAGLFAGWLHKPVPTIARKRLGRGLLLISTFRLARNLESNPLARHLLAELLALVSSSDNVSSPAGKKGTRPKQTR